MSPPYAVVASDLDGTLVRGDGTVSDRTRAALRLAVDGGASLVVVTGRPPRWMRTVAEQLGHDGVAICANGALVYDLRTEEVVDTRPIADDVVRELVERLRTAIPGLGFAVETGTGFGHEPEYQARWWDDGAVVAELEALLFAPVAKLLARHERMSGDELLAAARAAVSDELATLTHSSREGLLEISAAGVTKATALAHVVGASGRVAGDVIAFGDMPNDLPMLAWAGHAVAVANAHPEVLSAVDHVTASNDDDGVAQVLEQLFSR